MSFVLESANKISVAEGKPEKCLGLWLSVFTSFFPPIFLVPILNSDAIDTRQALAVLALQSPWLPSDFCMKICVEQWSSDLSFGKWRETGRAGGDLLPAV